MVDRLDEVQENILACLGSQGCAKTRLTSLKRSGLDIGQKKWIMPGVPCRNGKDKYK